MNTGFRDLVAAKRTGAYDRDARALWRVVEPLLYWSECLQCWLIAPVGFTTNYASVPRLPLVYLWCGNKVFEPAVLHDLHYTLHAFLTATLDPHGKIIGTALVPCTREEADDVFLEAIRTQPEAVDEATAQAMHFAVRLGGESSWRADTTVQQPEFINQMILPPELVSPDKYDRQVHQSDPGRSAERQA